MIHVLTAILFVVLAIIVTEFIEEKDKEHHLRDQKTSRQPANSLSRLSHMNPPKMWIKVCQFCRKSYEHEQEVKIEPVNLDRF